MKLDVKFFLPLSGPPEEYAEVQGKIAVDLLSVYKYLVEAD